MGYPADTLAPDERLVLHRHPHWKVLIAPVLWIVLATAAAGLVWWWQGRTELSDTTRTVVGIATGAVWLILAVWLFVAPLVRWSTTHFVITDRRVMFRTGVFTKSGIDIPMSRINTVQFTHDLIARILRTGTLVIESASDDPLEFSDIPQVEAVHSLLYHELHEALDDDPR